jgi:hypothetical protein
MTALSAVQLMQRPSGKAERWQGVELAEHFVDAEGRTLHEALEAQRQPPAEHVCDVDHHIKNATCLGRGAVGPYANKRGHEGRRRARQA